MMTYCVTIWSIFFAMEITLCCLTEAPVRYEPLDTNITFVNQRENIHELRSKQYNSYLISKPLEGAATGVENVYFMKLPSRNLEPFQNSPVLQCHNIFVSGTSAFSPMDEVSLLGLLVTIITQELESCSLVITYDKEFEGGLLLEGLLMLPNTRQVVQVRQASDFFNIAWKSFLCKGYIFLQKNPQNLLEFARQKDYVWDFQGKYIIVGLSKKHLTDLTVNQKISYTENILGIVKGSCVGCWSIFSNQVMTAKSLLRVAHWEIDSFTPENPPLFTDKLINLHGDPVRVGAFEYRPSVMYERTKEGDIKNRYGRDAMLAEELVRQMNATLVYKAVPQNELWGSRSKNGTWDGQIGFLQRDDVDFGISNFYISNFNYRLLVVDHTVPFYVEVSAFLIRKPKPLPEWERIFYPFQLMTWIAIVIGLIVTGPLLNLLARAGDASAGILFMEGQAIKPKTRGVQLFIAFLWFYATIITTGYNSNLTAVLTVAKQPPTLDTFQELYESDLVVTGSGDFLRIALAKSANPYLNSLANRYHKINNQPDKLAAMVEDGKGVILQGQHYLNYMAAMHFTKREISSVRIMKETFSPYNVAFVTRRSSPLKRRLDILIQRIVEAGLVNYWFKESIVRAKKEEDKNRRKETRKEERNSKELEEEEKEEKENIVDSGSNGVQPLGFAHMQGFFFALFIGLLLSAFAFVLEISCKKKVHGGESEIKRT